MQRLRQILDSGKTVIGAWCFIPDPAYLGMVANQGFDVTGVELSEIAVRAFFAEAGLPFEVREAEGLAWYRRSRFSSVLNQQQGR